MFQNPYFQPQQTFQNPYLERLQNLQPKMEITRINGRGGAEAFQMPPSSSVLLLDETQPIVWLKQTDGAGYPSLNPYQITPYQAQPEPDYKSLDERLKRLEERLNGKSDFTAADAESADKK